VDVYKEDTDHVPPATPGEIDVLEIDEALERLGAQDQRLAQAVELHYFGGLTYVETARALGVSEATVHRDLRLAKAWILRQINSSNGIDSEADAAGHSHGTAGVPSG
jgi:DNA-directed RNA polymerase specialized sigma24 family protein